MKKRLLALLIGLTVSVQGLCFAPAVSAAEPSATREIIIDSWGPGDIGKITVTEGETVKLVPSETALNGELSVYYVNFSSSKQRVLVTQDLELIGLSAGVEKVSVYIGYEYPNGKRYEHSYPLEVTIKEGGDTLSKSDLKELKRLEGLDGCYRRRAQILGAIDKDAPRLDMEKVEEILASTDDHFEIFAKFNECSVCADVMPQGGGMTSYSYWFDDKGSETVTWYLEMDVITYTKTADDSTVVGAQELFPDRSELLEGDLGYNYEYREFNQVKPEGFGKVTLSMIDESTGKPFTETNGRFQLIAKTYDEDGAVTEEIYKTWDSSEGTTIAIGELPIDKSYELRYIDEYHEDENGGLYRYEVDKDKGTHIYSFEVPREYSFNVYLKRINSTDPVQIKYIMGDVNGDNRFNIADLVTMERYILGQKDAVIKQRSAADFCKDNVLDMYDLVLMKRALVDSGEAFRRQSLDDILKMTDEQATDLFSGYTMEEIEHIWGKFGFYFSGLYGGGWEIGDQCISLVFDHYTDRLESASIYPLPTEAEKIESLLRNRVNFPDQTVETLNANLRNLTSFDIGKRIDSVTVYDMDGNVMTEGKVKVGIAKSVVICYDGDKRLEFDVIY